MLKTFKVHTIRPDETADDSATIVLKPVEPDPFTEGEWIETAGARTIEIAATGVEAAEVHPGAVVVFDLRRIEG